MTTAGIYNYHPTVGHFKDFPIQTASQQKPFYFGGSQVPVNLQTKYHEEDRSKGQGLSKHKVFYPHTRGVNQTYIKKYQ